MEKQELLASKGGKQNLSVNTPDGKVLNQRSTIQEVKDAIKAFGKENPKMLRKLQGLEKVLKGANKYLDRYNRMLPLLIPNLPYFMDPKLNPASGEPYPMAYDPESFQYAY